MKYTAETHSELKTSCQISQTCSSRLPCSTNSHYACATITCKYILSTVSDGPFTYFHFTYRLSSTKGSSKTGIINAWQQLQMDLVLGKIHIVNLGYIISVQPPSEANPLLHFETSLFFHHSENICHLLDRHHLQQQLVCKQSHIYNLYDWVNKSTQFICSHINSEKSNN